MKINNRLDRSFSPFAPPQVAEAIKRTKNSTAAGPNGITALHLKHLGPKGLRFLTRLFTLSICDADIPVIWRSADIVPVPKPGKPLDQGLSYRPISLLCPEIKVLERLLIPFLTTNFHLNPTQHGFRPQRSTVTALIPLATSIPRGFNQPKPASRTGLLSVDISKAFNVVRRELLKKIDETQLDPNIKRWFLAYLMDRRVRVIYQGAVSKWKKSKLGMPQGAVSSPPLWNLFGKDLRVEVVELALSYADDFHGATSNSDTDVISKRLNQVVDEMAAWADNNEMLRWANPLIFCLTPDN